MSVSTQQWIIVRPEPPGQFTAQVLGIPDVRVVASDEEQAIKQAQLRLSEWLSSARLISISVSAPNPRHPLIDAAGYAKDDAEHQLYLEEIRRYRQELEERECQDSSSTPTT